MRRSQASHWALLVTASFFSGCAYLEHDIGRPLPLESIDSFPTGSHFAEVLEDLGPPTKVTALSDGMAFLYEHVLLTERQYGVTLPGEIGQWIKAVYASADADVEIMLFIFDGQGKLLGADTQTWSADAGAGMSMTMAFSVGSFTDTEAYESSPTRSLNWGKGLTTSPLVGLNARQSLETGAGGVQLTTNSKGVGQHTLELE